MDSSASRTMMRGPLLAALTVFLFVDVLLLATHKLGDYDTWYYLAAGRHIAQTGSLLHAEPFAYTVPGTPWHTQTWLSSVLFHAVHSLGGVGGLILFNALLVACAFLLVFLTMAQFSEREGDFPLAFILTLVAAFAARFRFMVRPHVVEFVCLAGMLYLLNRHRLRGGRGIFLVPLVQLLWVNAHGSHILGLALPLLFALGSFLQGRFSAPPEERAAHARLARSFALVFAASAIATFLNPSTYKAFVFPFTIVGQRAYMERIAEWRPLRLTDFTGYGLRYVWGFAALALLALAGFVRSRRRPDFTGILLFLFLFFEATRGIRLTAEFGIAISTVAFRGLAGLNVPRRGVLRHAPAAVALAALLAVPWVAVFSSSTAFGLGVKEEKFPARAVEFVKKNWVGGTMFNSFAFGDYLTWAVGPERQVSIHGRNDIFPEQFFLRHFLAETSAEGWEKAVKRYGFTYAIIQYRSVEHSGWQRSKHLASNPQWVPVYWDPVAIVYLRDVPWNAGLIKRFGYRYIRPAYLDFSYVSESLGRGLGDQLLAELDRHLGESPDDEEGYISRAIVRSNDGRSFSEKAVEDMKAALAINPDRARSHGFLGYLYQRGGKLAEAEKEYRIALGLDPTEKFALAGLKKAGE